MVIIQRYSNKKFYTEYQRARDKSWEILLRYQIDRLPVRVSTLLRLMGIKFYSYTKGWDLICMLKLEPHTSGNDGFCTKVNGHYIIFYDETVLETRQAFTVAHELGHIVLGHLDYPNSAFFRATVWNRGEKEPKNTLETCANVFASRLLSPACVLWGLDIHDTKSIQTLCRLSYAAAKIRKKRMDVLYQREAAWLPTRGYSPFLSSKEEQLVFKQFQPYILEQKKERPPDAGTSNGP